jgi:hypothetical protein
VKAIGVPAINVYGPADSKLVSERLKLPASCFTRMQRSMDLRVLVLDVAHTEHECNEPEIWIPLFPPEGVESILDGLYTAEEWNKVKVSDGDFKGYIGYFGVFKK